MLQLHPSRSASIRAAGRSSAIPVPLAMVLSIVSLALGTAWSLPLAADLPASTAARSRLTDDLRARIAAAGDEALLSVVLTVAPALDLRAVEEEMDRLGLGTRWKRHRYVLERAQAHTIRTQAELLSYLEASAGRGEARGIRPYWVTNAIAFEATPALLSRLAEGAGREAQFPLAAVSRIHYDAPVHLKTGEQEPLPPPSRTRGELGSNLIAIHAPEVWARGLTGAGRLVGHFDAGVEGTHLAFADRWRGARNDVPWQEAWFDPYTGTEFPYGVDQGHGTGTLGVILAQQPGGPPLGVAYEAEWIAAGVVIRYNVSRILAAFEWAADPDGDPSTIDDVPDLLNHSWGTPGDCTTEYWDAIDLCEAAGIVNIIAVDNSGPSPASVNSPESRAVSPYQNFGVGGVDTNTIGFPVRSTSGRGPSPCDGTSLKPELVGPGDHIPGIGSRDNFEIQWSGTSFAAPHVSGVVALLRQLDPSLTVREIKHALLITAQDLGVPGEDNDTGWGLVDARAAVEWIERHITPSPPPFGAIGPADPTPVAILRWAPPRYLGRGEVPDLVGYRIYRTPRGTPFDPEPTYEVGAFPTELWDREAEGPKSYVVTAVYGDGTESEPTSPVSIEVTPPPVGSRTATPNLRVAPTPFRGATEIRFRLAQAGSTRLEVWDGAGRSVRTLLDRSLAAGEHVHVWNGTDDRGHPLPAGLYFLGLQVGTEGVVVRRVVRLP